MIQLAQWSSSLTEDYGDQVGPNCTTTCSLSSYNNRAAEKGQEAFKKWHVHLHAQGLEEAWELKDVHALC